MFGRGKNNDDEKKLNLENMNSVDDKIKEINDETNKNAEELMEDEEGLEKLIKEAEKKAKDKNEKNGFVRETWETLKIMFELVKLYLSGDYRNIPYKSVILIIGAIIYFVMPADAIPDWIAAVGFTDDVAVITFTFNQVKADLNKFLEWKKKQENNEE